MAVLKSKEIANMAEKDIDSKIKELKIEMIKSKVGNKKSSKLTPKELRKAIARLMTFKNRAKKNKPEKKIEKKKKEDQDKPKEAKK